MLSDLACLYLHLAHGADHHLSDDEIDVLTDRLRSWQAAAKSDQLEEAVREAVDAYRNDTSNEELESTMARLAGDLSVELRRRIIDDLVEIAVADGRYLHEEGSFIGMLAERWELHVDARPAEEARMWSIIPQDRQDGRWSVFHDLALVYITLAHRTDGEIAKEEVSAIREKLNEWLPGAKERDVLHIVDQALEAYLEDGGARSFDGSVEAVREAIPDHQREALLQDLQRVAEADGALTDEERRMIRDLAERWNVGTATLGSEG